MQFIRPISRRNSVDNILPSRRSTQDNSNSMDESSKSYDSSFHNHHARKEIAQNLNYTSFVGRRNEISALQNAIDKLMGPAVLSVDNDTGSNSDVKTVDSNIQKEVKEEEGGVVVAAPRVISVSGVAGSGKSKLVEQCQSQVMERGGYFITGKMDQQSSRSCDGQAQAYSGLATAMSALAEQIVARDFDMGIRRRLQETIREKDDAKVLTEIFPALSSILQVDDDENDHDAEKGGITDGVINSKASPLHSSTQLEKLQRLDSTTAALRSNKRRFLFQRFMRALLAPHQNYQDEDVIAADYSDDDENNDSSPSDTLVIVLEDLQWVDVPSLDLISALVKDRDLERFLLIVTSRPLGDAHHPFVEQVKQWKEQSICVQTLVLGDMDLADMNALLSHLLDTADDPSTTLDLSKLVHQKTSGNPFFAIEFVKALVEQFILTYSFSAMKWKYNIQRAQSLILDGDDTAIGLLTSKLKGLSLPQQLVLAVASCLGLTFREEGIALHMRGIDGKEIMGSNYQCDDNFCTEATLSDFVKMGFLGRNGQAFFFAHDLVQQAAAELVPFNRNQLLKLRVGDSMLQTVDWSFQREPDGTGANYEFLFLGVDLCNSAHDLLLKKKYKTTIQLHELARFNLLAAQKALRESAFALSLRYAESGLRLYDVLLSQCKTDVTLELSLLGCLAEAIFGTGDMEGAYIHAERLLEHHDCPEDVKFRMIDLKILSATLQMKLKEALKIGWKALVLLDAARFPKKPGILYVTMELMKTKRALRGHTKETILGLPMMEDERRITASKIYDSLLTACFIRNPQLYIASQLKCLRWSLKYGVTKYTPASFVIFGMILINMMGEVQKGVLYADTALALSERLKDKEKLAITMLMTFVLIHPWKHEIRTCFRPLLYSQRLAMEYGDIDTAADCLFHADSMVWCGSLSPLQVFSEQLDRHYQLCLDFKHRLRCEVYQIFALGLRRLCADNATFEWSDVPSACSTVSLSPAKESALGDPIDKDPLLDAVRDALLLQAHLLLDEKEEALKLAHANSDAEEALVGLVLVPRILFYCALVFFNHASSGKKWRKHRKAGNQALLALKKKFVDRGHANCSHMVRLLEAEVARLKGDFQTARMLYDDAILRATRGWFTHDAGISNKCAGTFFLQINDPKRACFHMEQAIKCFNDWGATAVSQRISTTHSTLISAHSVSLFSLSIGKSNVSLLH